MRKLVLLICFNFVCVFQGISQHEFDPSSIQVETKFPGGNENLTIFIKENLIYPEMALIKKDFGKVYIDALVDSLGRIIEVKIKQGVSDEIDLEALRIVSIMPLWESAINNDGEKTTVPIRLMINFPENKEAFKSKEIKAKRKAYKKKKNTLHRI